MTDQRTLQLIMERETNAKMRDVCIGALREINKRIEAFDLKHGLDAAFSDAQVFEFRRMANLSEAINEVLATVAPEIAAVVREAAEQAYTNSYYWTAFAADMTVPFELNFAGVNLSLLKASVDTRVAGMSLMERVSPQRLVRLFNERDIVAKAQLLGYGERKTAKEIVKGAVLDGVNTTYSQAACIARTESCRNATVAANQANADLMKENEIDIRNVWLSGHDERTRLSHRELDGKVADTWSHRYGQYCFSHGGGVSPGPGRWTTPGMNINCRCSMTQKILGYEQFECRSVETYYEWLGRIKDDPRYASTVATIRKSERVAA